MTKKQRLFFDKLPTSPSFAEAARSAGYSASSHRVSASRNLKNITPYNDFIASIFYQAGIDTPLLSRIFKEGLNSTNPRVQFNFFKLALEKAEQALTLEITQDQVNAEKTKIEIDKFLERIKADPIKI